MADEPTKEKPESKAPQLNLQALVDAISPKAAELIEKMIAGARANAEATMKVEVWVVLLAAAVVIAVATTAILAAKEGAYDTAERLLIPLISFAGGFGIGARVSRQTPRASG